MDVRRQQVSDAPWLLVIAAAALVAAWAAASATAALVFPPTTPGWIVDAATKTADGLGDPNASLVSLSLGRFPIVVMHGSFTCTTCHGPSGSAQPTGSYASLRFDALTHHVTDFGLAKTEAQTMSSLCGGEVCTKRRVDLDSAFRALDAKSRAISEPFDRRLGGSHCKIRLPVRDYQWIWGDCSVAMTITPTTTIVNFREHWNGLDRGGHRYAADSPRRHHLFVVTENPTGFVTSFRSSGDYPPQSGRECHGLDLRCPRPSPPLGFPAPPLPLQRLRGNAAWPVAVQHGLSG